MNATTEKYLKNEPPREIDLFTQSTIIFGGILNQIGWVFVGFGMIFFWVGEAVSGFENIIINTKNWEKIHGTIDEVSGTNSTENGMDVFQYNYSFKLNGEIYAGQSFTKGKQFEEKDEVTILFNFHNPEQSVIKGANRSKLSSWILLFLIIFPIVGAILVTIQTRSNLKNLKLLKIGDCTWATLINKEPTGGAVTINNKRYPEYKYTFEFSYHDDFRSGNYKSICKTHLAELVEDEDEELVLFDRYDPKENIIYDAVPNAPIINSDGNISPAPPIKMLGLIIPFLTISGNFIYLIFLLTQ